MDILLNINKWFDNLSDQYKTVAWLASLIIASVLTFLGFMWVAGIFILGLALDKVWWEFFANKPTPTAKQPDTSNSK